MKKWLFLYLIFGLFTLGAQEDERPYDFKKDDAFQYARPLTSVSPEGYDRQDCIFANRMVRTMVNRFRALSFQMERRCREKSGTGPCEQYVASMDSIVEKFNRQFALIKAKCTQD
ncbi:MAG: hypothetical protein DRQ89_00480 [Epsilonproteobacteria bacterium]|nr:MAG: hypothetical protein DRQ89_00480 [Campylobacterota bacterium]